MSVFLCQRGICCLPFFQRAQCLTIDSPSLKYSLSPPDLLFIKPLCAAQGWCGFTDPGYLPGDQTQLGIFDKGFVASHRLIGAIDLSPELIKAVSDLMSTCGL